MCSSDLQEGVRGCAWTRRSERGVREGLGVWSITGTAEVRRRSGGAPAKKYGGLGAWGGAGSGEIGGGGHGVFVGQEMESDRGINRPESPRRRDLRREKITGWGRRKGWRHCLRHETLTCGSHCQCLEEEKNEARLVCAAGLLLGQTARAREEERGEGLGGLGQKRAWLVFFLNKNLF